jgi:hypothetical protein
MQTALLECMNIGSARSETFVVPKSLDEALTQLGRADPTFNQELRRRLAPVKDRFFAPPPSFGPGDGRTSHGSALHHGARSPKGCN